MTASALLCAVRQATCMPLGGWWIRATAGPIIPAWRKNAKPESMIAVPAQKCQNRVYDQKCTKSTKIHKNHKKTKTTQKCTNFVPFCPPEFPRNSLKIPLLSRFVPLCPALSPGIPPEFPQKSRFVPLCPALSRFVPLCPALPRLPVLHEFKLSLR